MKGNAAAVFLPALLVLFFGGTLHGQTAAELDGLLEGGALTWARACRFVLPAAGVLEEKVSAPAAFEEARLRGWLPKGAAADGALSLGGLSFLIRGAFSIEGSLLYTLFPGPRYAYRQLAYLDLLPGPQDPGLKVSGERFLQILGRVLEYREEGEP
jgi:hypothetical protein